MFTNAFTNEMWHMFNAPTMVLFENLECAEDGLDRLLASILKLSGNFSEVLVPRSGTKHPDSYYLSFNKWLLGRLFYICSVKELHRVHIPTKDAQLKILNIVCMNQASFFDELHSEYFSILTKLIEYYENKCNNNDLPPLLLENFISEQINIPDVELNLTPIFVQLNDIDTCKALIDVVLQLLSETIPPRLLYVNKQKELDYENILSQVIGVLENYSIDLKLHAIKFFVKLIKNTNEVAIMKFNRKFPKIYGEFLCCLEAIVNSIDLLHDKSEVDLVSINSFNTILLQYLKMEKDYLVKEYEDILYKICVTVLSEKHRLFNKDLKLYCLSLSKCVKLPENLLEMQNKDPQEMEMLAGCYSSQILLYIQAKQASKHPIELKENWYYNQLLSVLNTSIEHSQQTDIFLVTYHLEKIYGILSILQYIDAHTTRTLKSDAYKSTISLLDDNTFLNVLEMLQSLIKQQYNKIVHNEKCFQLFLSITLSMGLNKVAIKDNMTKLWNIFFPTRVEYKTLPVEFKMLSDSIKAVIIRYAMATWMMMNITVKESWAELIAPIVDGLMVKKSSIYRDMVLMSPLLQLINVYSVNKIMGEILISALMNKNLEVQMQIMNVLPAITCISLGSCCVVLSSSRDAYGHKVYSNDVVDITVICAKCHNNDRSNTTSLQFIDKIQKEKRVLCTIVQTPDKQFIRKDLCNVLRRFLNYKQYVGIEEVEYWNLLGWVLNHYNVFNFGVTTDLINEENIEHALKALKPFIEVYKHDEDSEWNSHNDTVFNVCVQSLLKLTKTALDDSDYDSQTNILNCIKFFGMCRNEKVLLPATKLLVYYIMCPRCSVAPKAIVYLRDVCEAQGFTPNQVYHRYKKDLCKLFVECCLYNGKQFSVSLLKVLRAFGFMGYREFISKDVHHFLPYLVPYTVTIKEVPSMIEEIALLAQRSVSDFLIEGFPHIYVHLYLNEADDVASKSFNMIEKYTKMSTLALIQKHFRLILTDFLLQYCCNPEKVLRACRYLATHDPDASAPSGSMNMSTSQIADFLNPKFLGVLAYFDFKLISPKVALSVKRKALKSFPNIMQLMGVKYLTPLKFKVLATLRSALPLAKEFPKIVADAWGSFIQNIDTMSLGPLLTNLAVALIQQFEYAPVEINQNFQYLILYNENLLSSYIPNLFFVLHSDVTDTVKIVIKRHVDRVQPGPCLEKIKWYLQHLNQDISIIKACTFSNLDELLKSNRTELHKAIFGGKVIDPVIVELIDALLLGCKDSDTDVTSASAACLGQLGAIESGHLPRQYVQTDKSPFAFSIKEDCFASAALTELCRAFQYEKESCNIDSYALTMQEILKVYEISPHGSNKKVWESFSEQMHQILGPLLSSRYTLAFTQQARKVHPIFGSQYATTFLEWAHNWSYQLIPLVESDIKELLYAVHPSMRRDAKTFFLFLPYILLHAIMSKNNTQFIKEEMLAVIALENLENEYEAPIEKSINRVIRHVRLTPKLTQNVTSVQAEEGHQSKCRKTIYTIFDFLNRWVLEFENLKTRPVENENYRTLVSFLEGFDKLTIARGNFACGELERALQYLEMYMGRDEGRIQEQLPLLAEIHALLDDPDSVAGIMSLKRSEPSLKELILGQVVTGRLQDAAFCYERLAQEGKLDRNTLRGMVDCYLALDQPFTAYRLLCEHDEDNSIDMAAEPLWRLGRFEQLEELAKTPVPSSRENWGLLMGRILLSYRQQDHDEFANSCKDAMTRLVAQINGESRGESAVRSEYQSILGLHIVTEARHVGDVLQRLQKENDNNSQNEEIVVQLLGEWRRRLAVVQSDVRTVEPLLRTRRALLQQTEELLKPTHPITANKFKKHIGDLWLQSAKHARKAGIVQQAYTYILNAEEYKPEALFIEKAKMYWARGQNEHAFTTLRRGLDEAYPQIEALNQDQRRICAKAKFLIAKYNDETSNVDVNVNIGYYKDSVEVYPQWEKSLVSLGAYYEKVSSNDSTSAGTSSTNTNLMWSRRTHALNCYGKALQYGHKYLYQSMPRMLSIWLDLEVSATDTSVHSVLAEMTSLIKRYSERLPIYLFQTAFSQIVSRICHPVKEVYLQLKAIIVKLILAYPQHTLWMMMCVIKSGYPQRKKRCADVFADPRLKTPHMLKLYCDFTQLAEKLIELCNMPIGNNTTVSSLVRTLPRLLHTDNFSHIMMPFEEFCKIVLPSKAARQERIDFNIRAEPKVYIAKIMEEISTLPSLQKPKKVTLIGSDGKSYIILLKPKDDLRKDFRLMEFNEVVNRFLQDAPETRKRSLYIRTYCVLPLNEECGLIEWVPNLIGLRPVLMQIYKQKGIFTNNHKLKSIMCSHSDPLEKQRRVFEEQLLVLHPPVFQEWFRRVFSDPYGWYQARSSYIRTTAVMSMVGFILGLGDRHGENISFDNTNGDTVHVDFNCLFNKGETFEWPERVPFRLTHNLLAAMGPLKHEGPFRKSCEAVMRVLRSQTAALMSVITPFVYDPLVSWGRTRAPLDCAERTNDHALLQLEHIRQRLNGMVKLKNKQYSLPLSPEGQVEHLIAEATSVINLCQMYIGWGPYL
ncbi:serine/threonine-protein kinase ATR isoform X2 [Epargyreus clarus]|uniref:serine/threonine-protein kinase ATR isoform X2 n=1 Tax=Epargyreus clarus TaxID=520877 RepID=UPI003C303598